MRFLPIQLVGAHVQRQWPHPVCLHLGMVMVMNIIINMVSMKVVET